MDCAVFRGFSWRLLPHHGQLTGGYRTIGRMKTLIGWPIPA